MLYQSSALKASLLFLLLFNGINLTAQIAIVDSFQLIAADGLVVGQQRSFTYAYNSGQDNVSFSIGSGQSTNNCTLSITATAPNGEEYSINSPSCDGTRGVIFVDDSYGGFGNWVIIVEGEQAGTDEIRFLYGFQESSFVSITTEAAFPVELTRLSATPTSKTTHLAWQTASESANRGFHLQHSPNGQSWTTLDFIPGAGTSQTVQNYTYTHQNPTPGTNYYRLAQEDYDGTRTLSEVVTAEFSGVGELTITPNPATELITVNSPLLVGGEAFTLTVYDAAGRQLLRRQNETQLTVDALPSGVYTLLLNAGGEVRTERFVRR